MVSGGECVYSLRMRSTPMASRLADARTRRVAESFNTIFNVIDDHGFSGALRIGPAERIHAEGTEIVEARWMRELHGTRAAAPPEVFNTRNGGPVVRQAQAGRAG